MRTIVLEYKTPFAPYLEMAKEAVKQQGIQVKDDEELINIAKHQSVIHQDKPFDDVRKQLGNPIGVNLALEPMDLTKDKSQIVWHVTLHLVEPNHNPDFLLDLMIKAGFAEADIVAKR